MLHSYQDSVCSATTENAQVKSKPVNTCTNPYDMCDPSMFGDIAILPEITTNEIPLCYADGRIEPKYRRDNGSRSDCIDVNQ